MNEAQPSLRIIPWIVAISLFMETLDTTIIVTAIPKIADSFGVPPLDIRFALTSYLLSLALFIPLTGWVVDKWGTQRTFLFALALFTLSSVGCGKATDLTEFVIGRVFQGIAGALMMPVGRLIVLRAFPKTELVRVMNFITTPALLGPILGPLVGGMITHYYSWPWIFYLNVPVGILGIACILRYMRNETMPNPHPFDWTGFFLLGGSLLTISFSFESISIPFIPPFLSLLIALLAILGFFALRRHYGKTSHPILHFELFKLRTFSLAAMSNILVRLGTSSAYFLLPLFFQIGYGVTPIQSGLLTSCLPLGMIFSKLTVKKVLHKWGLKKLFLLTSPATGGIIACYSLVDRIDIPLILALTLAHGLMIAAQSTASTTLFFTDVEQRGMSAATTITSMIQQLIAGVGITLGTLLLQLFAGWHHPIGYGDSAAFRPTFIVMGLISACSLFVFLKLRHSDGQHLTRNNEQ